MELLKHASAALQRHISSLVLYLGIAGIASAIDSVVTVYLLRSFPEGSNALPLHVITVVKFFALSLLYAYVQATVFARIGREMDRPLWKVRDDNEARRRFFMMWFEFNLIINTVNWLSSPTSEDTANALHVLGLFTVLGCVLVMVPIGAACMFMGRFSWSALGEALAPLSRRPMEAAPVFLVTFSQIVVIFLFAGQIGQDVSDTRHVVTLLVIQLVMNLALAYLDCLAFAAMWLVCKDDRDSPDEVDLDF